MYADPDNVQVRLIGHVSGLQAVTPSLLPFNLMTD